MENLPTLLCISLITVLFVIPMWAYINLTERFARMARDKAVEAGRHEPVTIQPFIDLSVCMGSGACVPACPEHVLTVIEGQALAVNMSACIGHGACVTACPVGAIELVFGSEKRGIDIPRTGPDFQSNVPGIFIAGELGGMGLIANATEQGIAALTNAARGLVPVPDVYDVVIVGAGPAGIAAAAAAKTRGINYVLVDQDDMGGAVRHYPRKKLVFTRPMEIPGYGKANFKSLHKEELVKLFTDVIAKVGLQLDGQERVDKIEPQPGGRFLVHTVKRKIPTQRVILALGRRGTPRKLDAIGEDQEKVAYSLLEPEHYQYDHIMVVGGGDSSVEAAMALADQPGNKVTLSYRGDKINRPKEKNIHLLRDAVRAGKLDLLLESQVKEISADRIIVEQKGETLTLPNDHVFVMVGGVLPTKFLQDAGIKIQKHFGKRIVDDDGKKGGSRGDKPPAGDSEKPAREPKQTATPATEKAAKPEAAKTREAKPAPTALAPGLSFIGSTGSGRGAEEPTQMLRVAEEPTVALPPSPDVDRLSVIEASLPPPRPASGLALLDTHTLPESPLDELPNEFEPTPAHDLGDPAASGWKREVTQIQPLKRVSLQTGKIPLEHLPPAAPRTPSAEKTVLLPAGQAPPDDDPPSDPVNTEPGAPPFDDPGRMVASRPATGLPSRPRPVEEPTDSTPSSSLDIPASPISARLSRVAGSGRGPGARSGGPPTLGVAGSLEPRPEARPRGPVTRTVQPTQAGAVSAVGASDVVAPFVQSAQKLMASGDYAEALKMASNLSNLVEGSAATLSELELAGARRWVLLLEGEALLGLGAWEEAIAPLVRSADAARRLEGTTPTGEHLAPVLVALGRACHHTGRTEQAQAVLEEMTSYPNPAPLERTAALRLLGDLALRRGEVERAEESFNQALEVARRAGSSEAVGRAVRGLANCTAIRGHTPEALDQLLDALQQLRPLGDSPVVAGVLARIVELENVLGRYGGALVHGEQLVQISTHTGLPVLQAESLALVAETLAAVGLDEDAGEAADRAAELGRDLGPRGMDANLRAARVMCDIGRPADALVVLDAITEPPPSIVDDPMAQILAVRARAVSRSDPTLSRELANTALGRPAPLLAIRAARIRLDAALALHEAGSDAAARTAAKRGLKTLQGSGNKGLKLELLVAMYLSAPNHRVVEAAARTAMRVLEELPEHAVAAFRQRKVIGEALTRWSKEDEGGSDELD